MIYRENMIVRIEDDEFRVCDFDKDRDNLFLININKKCTLPTIVNSIIMDELFNTNKAKEIFDNNKITLATTNNISKKMIEKRDFYYEIICFLFSISKDYEIYYRDKRTQIINEAMKKYNVSYSTVKRILCIYLKNSKLRDSLFDNTQNCGGKNKERSIKIRTKGIIIDDNIKKLFKEGINKYYNTTKKNSIKMCYELIIRDYLREDKNKEIPTFKQFYYWYKKFSANNKHNEITKRFGERIYQQKARAIVGNSLQDTLGPADLYQVDSTILDVYIVSRLNRNIILGRPICYIVIDVYSRMVVGINVTIEPFNSYEGVKGALINAMTDKVIYCKKFGIDINKEQWVSATPSRILADRGELLSGNIENAITNLGIIIQNTSPYRGDQKGIVEKSFERLHSYIKPFVDGVVENKFNVIERGSQNYRLRANLNMEEITKIVILYILHYNNSHVLKYYESDGINIENNIPKIPNKLWEYGVKIKKGLLRELPEEVIKINLLHNKEGTVTAKGVKVNKLYYVSKYTLEQSFYQRARIEGSFKIRVSYDPNNLSEIYYIKEDGFSYDTLTLVTYMEQYRDICEEEINKIFEYEEKLNKKASEKEIREKITLFNEIEKITNKAKEEQLRNKDNTISKTQRLKNIRGNLEEERKLFRNTSNIYNESEMSNKGEHDELDIFDNVASEWMDDYE